MKKTIILNFILLLCLTLTSCSTSKELNKIGIILGAYIDKDPSGEYLMSIQSVKSKSKEGSDHNPQGYIINSFKGKTVFDAARNISLDASRRNYWPHTKILIVSERYAKEGIKEAADFVARSPLRRRTVHFMISKSDPMEIFNAGGDYEGVSSEELINLIKNSIINGFAINTSMLKFIEQSENVCGVGLMDEFVLSSNTDISPHNPKEKADNILSNTAIFFKYKLVDYITPEETRILNFMINKIKNCTLPIILGENESLTLEVIKSKTSVGTLIVQDKFFYNLKININANIVNYNSSKDFSEINYEELTDKINKDLEKKMKDLFDKSKNQFQLDIFGSGNYFSYKYPYILSLSQEQWNRIFVEKVELNPKVNFKITFTGILNNKLGE